MVVTLRLTDWDWNPTSVAGLWLTAAAYLWVLHRFRVGRRQQLYFWAGFSTLVVALLSPVHTGAPYSFTLHMVQHMLLMMVAPPLLVLGVPSGVVGWLHRRPSLWHAYRALWSPVPAFVLYNGVLLLWHSPAAYIATLEAPWIHAAEHASFVAVGLVFWGVIVSPAPTLVQADLGVRITMLFGTEVVNFLLGLALAFSDRVFYWPYTVVPHLWGLSALQDQKLGGSLMWVMGQMMYVIPLLILIAWFLGREERVQQRREAQAAHGRN
ncbi:MAG TPA: cytochrome c oxidase assembly protein [bacterium]|nr:cytochrome c oxidase assembly protein [bacterium]